MNNPTAIAKLKDSMEKVEGLLEDMQPGLFTWHLAFGDACEELKTNLAPFTVLCTCELNKSCPIPGHSIEEP